MLHKKNFRYEGEVLTIDASGTFATGEVAWHVFDEHGQHYTRLSVNLGFPPDPFDPTVFWIKDWSENKGIVTAAIEQGVIEIVGGLGPVESGHVLVRAARLVR